MAGPVPPVLAPKNNICSQCGRLTPIESLVGYIRSNVCGGLEQVDLAAPPGETTLYIGDTKLHIYETCCISCLAIMYHWFQKRSNNSMMSPLIVTVSPDIPTVAPPAQDG